MWTLVYFAMLSLLPATACLATSFPGILLKLAVMESQLVATMMIFLCSYNDDISMVDGFDNREPDHWPFGQL